MTPDLPPPPAELDYLSAHLTPQQLLALIRAYGGTQLYIPKGRAAGGALVSALGREATDALSAWRGGEEIKVPIARHWQILCLRKAGLSYSEIARELRITEGSVWSHLNAGRMTTKPKQLDLFG